MNTFLPIILTLRHGRQRLLQQLSRNTCSHFPPVLHQHWQICVLLNNRPHLRFNPGAEAGSSRMHIGIQPILGSPIRNTATGRSKKGRIIRHRYLGGASLHHKTELAHCICKPIGPGGTLAFYSVPQDKYLIVPVATKTCYDTTRKSPTPHCDNCTPPPPFRVFHDPVKWLENTAAKIQRTVIDYSGP